jgi:hypothetical protein
MNLLPIAGQLVKTSFELKNEEESKAKTISLALAH